MQATRYHGRVDNQAIGNVKKQLQQGIGGKEHPRDIDAADGTVVKRTLKPLSAVGGGGVGGDVGEIAT